MKEVDQDAAPEEPKAEGEEEVDIDLNDPDVEKAATKIQAGFKGMKTRQEIASMKQTDGAAEEEPAAAPAAAEEPAAPAEEQPAAEESKEEEVDIDLTDPEVEKAATKIQAGFKGMKTRKEIKENSPEKAEGEPAAQEEAPKEDAPAEEAPKEEAPKEESKEEEVDIDLTDPEVEKAATKIQAGFKGMKTRKEIKENSPEKAEGEAAAEEPKAEEAGEAPAEEPKAE